MTPGFRLRARWIVHTVGPVWHGGDGGEPALLASCYRGSIEVARDAGAASIAFSGRLHRHLRLPGAPPPRSQSRPLARMSELDLIRLVASTSRRS